MDEDLERIRQRGIDDSGLRDLLGPAWDELSEEERTEIERETRTLESERQPTRVRRTG